MLTLLKPVPERDWAMTKAEAMAATLESNRSAPMPATSPTLSPTLSAMTAGLRGVVLGDA